MAPKFLGVDEQGRQILEFIEGRAVDPAPWQSDDVVNAAQLGAAAAMLAELHAATSTFDPPAGERPRRNLANAGDVWTHGDVGYSNLVFSGRKLVAAIDWEFAAPGHRYNDLAALVAVAVRGPKMGAPDNDRRERAVDLAIDAVSESYGLDDAAAGELPRLAANVIDDFIVHSQMVSAATSFDAWKWRAAWFRQRFEKSER